MNGSAALSTIRVRVKNSFFRFPQRVRLSVNAQVLIVVEVLDHYASAQGRKEAQLQIRFPNSAAIAAESRHGDRDNNFAHREIFFTAATEGTYKYCMRDLPVSDHNTPAIDTGIVDEDADQFDALHTRRVRLEVRSRFKTAPAQMQVECLSALASDCELPDHHHQGAKAAEL